MTAGVRPTVSVVIPTYREAEAIQDCLAAVAAQTYPEVIEVLVVDGGSDDGTPALAADAGATVLENPRRIQSAALNIAIEAAKGDVIVRVDGHCLIAHDYVERCVAVLEETGAAMVGGAMTPVATGAVQEGIAAAMASPFGAGPARFHTGGEAAWVDTVYLGAYRTEMVRSVGGYADGIVINEDAELAHRMQAHGGVRFDPTIRSTYTPRSSLAAVGRQFLRYGWGRSLTAVRHPASVQPRQLAAPALVIGLASPARRWVAGAYTLAVGAAVLRDGRQLGRSAPAFIAALPIMHLTWGTGFLVGLGRAAVVRHAP
ncbi:glycosyltransferase family 2 protein [Iamia sp. SCSIO 61187]|uniref:glycosyltransferase family 2 protein n=1 Tax=Iamia sp. SCSIO 61187 TaxID=2722752 RepID=UPI001C627950|nr:glycosyltransferase family 2 protein [Iamia sp. SCSIO 61187]QYG93308.1 glycosyltransferase family 2 protein [Iamia sp. SCSIO 61187]